ncbi:MAG: glycosyltransferase family 2 protein [Deferrisomatales bacterium]
MKVLAILPAYNEAESLPKVLASFRSLPFPVDVLVVDDGSKDRTARVAREHGARVVSLPFNLGIGGAVQTGYLYAKENGYDAAVQVDADGQHDPQEIHRLLEPLSRGEADFVAGSRFLNGSSPYPVSLPRRMGICYFSWLLTALLRTRVTDPTSGFRAGNRQVILLFAEEYPTDYPEVETLVLLHRNGLRTAEVPVRMAPRQGGQSSISFGRAAYYMVKVTLGVFVQMIRGRSRLP